MAALDEFARDAGTAIMLVSHPAKHDQNAEDAAGSGDWSAAARTVWCLNHEATKPGRHRRRAPRQEAEAGTRALPRRLEVQLRPAARQALAGARRPVVEGGPGNDPAAAYAAASGAANPAPATNAANATGNFAP